MAGRKPFLLRIDPEVLAALQRWAGDELRSVNGQIEFLLRRALQREGRLPDRGTEAAGGRPPRTERSERPPETDLDDTAEETDS